MIKPNELRIGNRFTADHEPAICTVNGIDQAGIIIGTHMEAGRYKGSLYGNYEVKVVKHYVPFQQAHAIPLTPEWLRRLGFEKVDPSINDNWYIQGIIVIEFIDNKATLIIGAESVSRQMLYVHHLQNLIFALTGEELTIKETV